MDTPKKAPARYTAWGETKTLSEWVKDPRCAVSIQQLSARLSWNASNPERSISTPPKTGKKYSRFVGVSYDHTPEIDCWIAQIRKGRKVIKIGYFSTELEAALAYDKVARTIKSTARLNFRE